MNSADDNEVSDSQKFHDIFDGKKIAVVGNSKGLFESNLGRTIDSSSSYDLVCRMNKAFRVLPPYTRKYTRHIGSRIDVLFVNLYRTSGYISARRKRKEVNPTKIIQTSPCSYDDPSITRFVSFIPKRECIQGLFDDFDGYKPSTGLRVLYLLNHFTNAESVDVFGFDWKQKNPTFCGSKDNWSQTHHNFIKERDYCMENFFSSSKKFTLWEID